MLEKLKALEEEARAAVDAAADLEELKGLKVRYLGKKGELTALLRGLGSVPAEERPLIGKEANDLRQKLEQMIDRKESRLKDAGKSGQWEKERIDVTLPGLPTVLGQRHPLTLVLDEIKDIFYGLGFQVAHGPDIETDFYNFEALNIPADHPARDMQDSFYINPGLLLRTHTSPVQIRTMENSEPPFRMICPGRVYRCDSDLTHTPMFHQVEGLLVDRHVSFADLKSTVEAFLRAFFERDLEVRFRPSYFPFTEPSAEVDIEWGREADGSTKWLEIMGCGMVHPRVFENCGIDSDQYSGFAFGLGVERMAMLRYGVRDLRMFFENDLRFLRQFR